VSIAPPTLRSILRALYGPCDGLINFRALGPGYASSCFYALADTQGIAAFLGMHVSEHDCYMGMATRVDDSSGDASNLLHLNALFADLDFIMSSERETRARLDGFLYPPSVVWHSGGGLQPVWVMAEPFDMRNSEEASTAGSLLRRLAAYLNADPASAEGARVLRVPQTFNRKPAYGTPPRVTVECYDPQRVYQPSDFDAMLPAELAVNIPHGKFTVPDIAGPSERNATLFKLGRSLKANKVSPGAIIEALRATNAAHCVPPHSDQEVSRVFDSVMRRRDRPRVAASVGVHTAEPEPVPPAPDVSPTTGTPADAPPAPDAAPSADASTPPPAGSGPALDDAAALAALLDDTVRYVRRFVFMTDHQAAATALWTAHTHTYQAAEATPYLHVTAATKRAGKTLLLEVLEPVVARPWLTSRTSAAALPRKIDAQQPTLLLDESDQALSENSDYSKALTGVLNSGYRKSGMTSLCIGEGANLKVVDLKTFCPKAIAGIGKLPDTVADRSIQIKLRRRTREERVERARARVVHGAGLPLQRRWQSWAPAATRALLGAAPALPEGIDDRAQDVWEALLAIAERASGDWPSRAHSAAVALSGSKHDDDYATLLLSDVRDVMDAAVVKDERGPAFDVVVSTALLKKLNRLKEQPWPTWSKGHEMTPHALARLLASFDVLSSQHWVAGRKVRGYRRVTFDDLFPRYLPVKASTRENSNNDGGESTNSDRYEPESPTASPSGENPMDAGNSPVSSVWNPLRAPTAQPHAFHAEPPTKGGRNGQPVTDHPSDHDHQEPHHTNEGE